MGAGQCVPMLVHLWMALCVLCVPAGWSDPHRHSGVCKWSKDIAVSVGCGLCVAESCLLWGPWLTLG